LAELKQQELFLLLPEDRSNVNRTKKRKKKKEKEICYEPFLQQRCFGCYASVGQGIDECVHFGQHPTFGDQRWLGSQMRLITSTNR